MKILLALFLAQLVCIPAVLAATDKPKIVISEHGDDSANCQLSKMIGAHLEIFDVALAGRTPEEILDRVTVRQYAAQNDAAIVIWTQGDKYPQINIFFSGLYGEQRFIVKNLSELETHSSEVCEAAVTVLLSIITPELELIREVEEEKKAEEQKRQLADKEKKESSEPQTERETPPAIAPSVPVDRKSVPRMSLLAGVAYGIFNKPVSDTYQHGGMAALGLEFRRRITVELDVQMLWRLRTTFENTDEYVELARLPMSLTVAGNLFFDRFTMGLGVGPAIDVLRILPSNSESLGINKETQVAYGLSTYAQATYRVTDWFGVWLRAAANIYFNGYVFTAQEQSIFEYEAFQASVWLGTSIIFNRYK